MQVVRTSRRLSVIFFVGQLILPNSYLYVYHLDKKDEPNWETGVTRLLWGAWLYLQHD